MAHDFTKLFLEAGAVFSPSAPIDRKKLFAGRLEQLTAIFDSITTRGQHAVVYGERGVGKTSLVSVIGEVVFDNQVFVVRENCSATDVFGRLWRRAFEQVKFRTEQQTIGFNAEVVTTMRSLAQSVSEQPTPDEVVSVLRRFVAPVVFVFDEFDQLSDRTVSKAFADVIKALSDFAVSSKIVLVGVGDTVDALIESHASVERAIRQIRMPRMEQSELMEIITKALGELGMTYKDDPANRIVHLAHGLPHYVHLIGLHATRSALRRQSMQLEMADVDVGITAALSHTAQSLLDLYVKATATPRADAIYREVLLACGLAKTDQLGYFTPAAVRLPLKELGRPLQIPAFAGHLNKFASDDRGRVLQKTGEPRRYRYRFRNPLLQPFVIMRGIADKLVSADKAEKLLAKTA